MALWIYSGTHAARYLRAGKKAGGASCTCSKVVLAALLNGESWHNAVYK